MTGTVSRVGPVLALLASIDSQDGQGPKAMSELQGHTHAVQMVEALVDVVRAQWTARSAVRRMRGAAAPVGDDACDGTLGARAPRDERGALRDEVPDAPDRRSRMRGDDSC